ncbi:MAG: hypothetical protein Q9183_003811 [Haloplaca sp. 2 TL-2023]
MSLPGPTQFEETLEKAETLATVLTSLKRNERLRLFGNLKSQLEALTSPSLSTEMPTQALTTCLQRAITMHTILHHGFDLPDDLDAPLDRLVSRLIDDMQRPKGELAVEKAKVGNPVKHPIEQGYLAEGHLHTINITRLGRTSSSCRTFQL